MVLGPEALASSGTLLEMLTLRDTHDIMNVKLWWHYDLYLEVSRWFECLSSTTIYWAITWYATDCKYLKYHNQHSKHLCLLQKFLYALCPFYHQPPFSDDKRFAFYCISCIAVFLMCTCRVKWLWNSSKLAYPSSYIVTFFL
jgi:hypothetical protein